MSPALGIDALGSALDRSLLHVFVAGPGYGEGIAVALPERGWLLIDGCQLSTGELPLNEIVHRWRDGESDVVDCLALTHPHEDHAYGIRRLIEDAAPVVVAVSTSPAAPADIFRVYEDPAAAPSTGEQRKRGTVLEAMRALAKWNDAHPGMLVALVDGQPIHTSTGHVQIVSHSPQIGAAERMIAHARAHGTRGHDANELSAVFSIVFGGTRVVLGSDLARTGRQGAAMPGGWDDVMAAYPHLGSHVGLKVPHHASAAAFHPELMTEGSDRAWLVTPFSKPPKLPTVEAEGIPRLVQRNQRVLLTATPRRRDQQPVAPLDGVVRVGDLDDYFRPAHSVTPGASIVSPPEMEPMDPVWCVAFDDAGVVRGTWRGTRALSIVP